MNLGVSFENPQRARSMFVFFPVFPCPRKNKKIKNALVGESRKWGVRSRFFSIQWTSHLSGYQGYVLRHRYVFLSSPTSAYRYRIIPSRSVVVLSKTQENGTRERARGGREGGVRKKTSPNSRESKKISLFSQRDKKGEKGRGVAVKCRVLRVPSCVSFFLAFLVSIWVHAQASGTIGKFSQERGGWSWGRVRYRGGRRVVEGGTR